MLLAPQPTSTTMQCSCHWALLSSSASGTYSHGIERELRDLLPHRYCGTTAPCSALPSSSGTGGKTEHLEFIYTSENQYKNCSLSKEKDGVITSDFQGLCSPVTCLQQWLQTDPCRTARAGWTYVIFPASPLLASNHFQLRELLEPDIVCPVVDLSSKYLPSFPLNAWKNCCD